MYFSPQSTVLEGADPSLWGIIAAPRRAAGKGLLRDGFLWLADNGCFLDKWDEQNWLTWLGRMADRRNGCVMACAPDVVGDARQTLQRYAVYAHQVRDLGYPVGLVAQDGMESEVWPDEYDALFIGGTTAWKLSSAADACILRAKREGKWVHAGRVNSIKRIKHFATIGVDSVDGTTICFAPNRVFPMIDRVLRQKTLFTLD